MASKTYIVYKHVSPDGRVYIGRTCNSLKSRSKRGKAYKGTSRFYDAINEIGWDNFEHVVLAEGLTLEEADKMEIETIAFYNATDPEKGYNRASGGTHGGYPHNEHEREMTKITSTGRKMPREAVERMRLSHIGKPLSEEHKRKLSEAHKGKTVSAEIRERLRIINTGKKMSDEARRKISKILIGNARSGMKIRCVETDEVFLSIRRASRAYKINTHTIADCCKGLRDTAGGYHWNFVND